MTGPANTRRVDAPTRIQQDVSGAGPALPAAGTAPTMKSPAASGASATLVPADMETRWAGALTGGQTPDQTIKTTVTGVTRLSSLSIRAHRIGRNDATGHYELLEVLGQGGMGVVYAARQTSMDRVIALKMIQPHAAADATIRSEFLAEAAITSDLDHPNIVAIHDLGSDESGALFYAMKLVKGEPWSRSLRTRPLRENLSVLQRVADAVAFAHARQVVHRDLKPDNVMLGGFGEVLLMDWGLAVATDAAGHALHLDGHGACAGTPAYMAPEMALGQAERIGPRSDIYLLGAILFEIVTGQRPHHWETAMACLCAAAANDIVATDQQGELLDIARTAMATVPEDRFASVKDLQAAVRGYLAHSESIVLSIRAAEAFSQAGSSQDYHDFARAMYTFEESARLWDGNQTALAGIRSVRIAYATCALGRGDLDLAASLLETAGLDGSPLVGEIRQAQAERGKRQGHLRLLRRLAVAAVLVITGLSVTGYALISREQARTEERRLEAQREAENARLARNEAVQAEAKAKASEKTALGEKAKADEEARRAKAVKDFMQVMFMTADPNKKGKELRVVEAMDTAAQLIDTAFEKDPLTCADLHASLGMTYYGLGQFDRFLIHSTRALELHRRQLGAEATDTAISMDALGNALTAVGRPAEAEPLQREALAIMQRTHGAEDQETVAVMGNLANTLYTLQKFAEAERLQRDKLEMQTRTLGPEHPQTLASMGNLANNLEVSGRFAEAETLFRKAIEAQQRVLSPEHPDTLRNRSNLAVTLLSQNRAAEAEALTREILVILTRKLGAEHPDTLRGQASLARALLAQGKLDAAEQISRKALTGITRSLGADHPLTAEFAGFLLQTLIAQDKRVEAESVLKQAVEAQIKAAGLGNPQTYTMLKMQEQTFATWGRTAEALDTCRKSLASAKALAAAVPADPHMQNNLAWELLTSRDQQLRDPVAALPLARRAVELSQNRDHSLLDTLALALYENAMVDEAIISEEQAMKLLQADAPERAQYQAAISWYRQVKATGKRPPGNPYDLPRP